MKIEIIVSHRFHWAPHQPVVSAILSSVANHQHTMVQLSTTGLGQNATLVELEGHLISLNCYRDRLLSHCIHQRLLIIHLDVHIALHTMCWDTHSAPGSLANTVLGSIRIAVLSAHGCLFLILEAIVHQSTTAALIAEFLGAIHQLLLRQRHQLARGDGPSTLQRTSGAEGPASNQDSARNFTYTSRLQRFNVCWNLSSNVGRFRRERDVLRERCLTRRVCMCALYRPYKYFWICLNHY